ncbi:hypothetical protein HDU93_002899 [Gonapodya sp. JEL0774]|nr:hypothetical protein HDU93_002899 [Gonapodya sp. JEL0774]
MSIPTRHFVLTNLPTEILLLIGQYLFCRLGLPTSALNKVLVAVFGTPDNIAARAIAHYGGSSASALVWESHIVAPDQHLVVEAIYHRVFRRPDFHIDDDAAGPYRDTFTPLNAAVEIGNVQVVRSLLKMGADATTKDTLQYACTRGQAPNVEVLKLLAEHGANLDGYDYFAIEDCSGEGYVEVVRFLLDQGSPVEGRGLFSGPLQRAARGGHREVVELLLERGADIHRDNNAALWNAVYERKAEMVELLLERGANPEGHSILKKHAIRNANDEKYSGVLLRLISNYDPRGQSY